MVFERYTERARQVVVLAQEEARSAGHFPIGTAHLVLGLLAEGEAIGYVVLSRLGVDLEHARATLLPEQPKGENRRGGQIPFSPEARTALENYALREALALGHNYIGTEHILLGVVRQEDGKKRGLLHELGLEAEQIRNEVIRQLSSSRQGRRTRTTTRTPAAEGSNGSDEPATASARETSEAAERSSAGLEAVPTHGDRPATRDELGRARLAEVLAERVRRVRGEDTEVTVNGWRDRRRKLARDRAAAGEAGSFMVHVHAPWGAGKSSLLNFLVKDLRNRREPDPAGRVATALRALFAPRRPRDPQLSRWLVVEFSAWKHQRLDPPWWWLLAAIRRSAWRELWSLNRGRWAWFVARDLGWRLWNSRVAWITLALTGALVLLATSLDWLGLKGSSLTTLKSTAASVSVLLAVSATAWGRIRGTSRWLAVGSAEGAVKFLQRAHDPLGVYRRRFRWLVQSAGHPIAVVIDDLDRCKPEYVVGLLEGIQTLFMEEGVTYVVAADRAWLCGSFASVYEVFRDTVGDPGRPLGFLFLEKTFQISMEVPPMTFADRRRYWRALTAMATQEAVPAPQPEDVVAIERRFAQARTHQEVEQQLTELLASQRDADRVLRAAVRRLNAPELQAQLEDLLEPFAPLLENNPRSMKRLVNAYGIERDRLLREGRLPSLEERKQLVLFTILRLRWPLFAEHLLKRPEELALCADEQEVPRDHPFEALLRDRDVRTLFDRSLVDVALDVDALRRYAGHEPLQSPSVGV